MNLYSGILENYLDCDKFIHSIEIALEADTNSNDQKNMTKATTASQTEKQPTAGANQALSDKIDNIIAKAIDALVAFIKRYALRLKNFGKKIMVSDSGFESKLNQRMSTVKPLPNINVTSYRYNEVYADTILDRMHNKALAIMKELEITANALANNQPDKESKNQIIAGSVDELGVRFIQSFIQAKDVESVDAAFEHIKEMYRGKKIDNTYSSEQLPTLIGMAKDYKKAGLFLGKRQLQINEYATRLANRKNVISRSSVGPDQKKAFVVVVNKAHKIFNIYHSVAQYIYQLKVERCLNYRVIVQRFYRF